MVDATGKVVATTAIYPHEPQKKWDEALATLGKLAVAHKVDLIAIGNGTASRETDKLATGLVKLLPDLKMSKIVVSEAGASVYSASAFASEELPELDVTLRGAVSIARRLQDPLAELVKIDPKAIGVGQYQHDVDQSRLKKGLDDVVMSCVNGVGVEVNTASPQILSYVAGLGPQLAKNIITWREENGPFKNRRQLMKVPRLGPKAFEQAAGFLRVRNSDNPLDRSAVHPESYKIVEKMAQDLGCSIEELLKDAQLRRQIKLQNYVTEEVGLPTLNDIMKELARPGLDPREKYEAFSFAEGIHEIKDLVVDYLQKKYPRELVSNNNVFWYNSDLQSFKIALAREIIQEAQYSNWDQERIRILVLLNFETASVAAQNALLKLIEEPPANTLIVLPVINSHRLLATISSRCSLCQINQENVETDKKTKTNDFTWPSNLAEVFNTIDRYKDRDSAKNFVRNLLEQKQLGYKEKKALAQAYFDLESNLNVRLALEHCFFSFFQ